MRRNTHDNHAYHLSEEVTLGDNWQLATSNRKIGFRDSSGRVKLFASDSQEEVIVEERAIDIELDRYILSLSEDKLSAYTASEVELWTQTVPSGSQIISLGEKDVVVVVTETDELIGLDLETGNDLFRVQRPHDDIADFVATGGAGVLCLGVWSFFVCIDTAGSIRFDVNLDSAIESVGLLDNTAVVALKGGELVGIDLETGQRRWSNSIQIRDLGSTGRETLPALDSSGPVLIHNEGRIESMELEDGNRIISPTDGSMLGIVEETTARVYRAGSPPDEKLEATVVTNKLRSGTPIRVHIKNTGTQSVDATVELDADPPLDLESAYDQVILGPDESCEIAFRPVELPTADHVTCLLRTDKTELTTDQIPVAERIDPATAVDISTRQESVENGSISYLSTIENTSQQTIDRVQSSEELVATDIEPGETAAVNMQFPLDGDERTLSVDIQQEGREVQVGESITTPAAAIDVTVSREDSDLPCISVTVSPTVSTPVQGSVTIDIDGITTLTRTIELEGSSPTTVVFVLPWSIAGQDTVAVTVESPLLESPYRTSTPGWELADIQHLSPQPEKQRDSTMPHRSTDPHTGAEQRSEQNNYTETVPERKDPTNISTKQESHTEHTEKQPQRTTDQGSERQLRIERKVPDRVHCTKRIKEEIQVHNRTGSRIDSLTITDQHSEQRLSPLDPSESRTITRLHAFFEEGHKQLSPIAAGATKTKPATLTVVSSAVTLRACVGTVNDSSRFKVYLSITNTEDRRIEITQIGLRNPVTEEKEILTLETPEKVLPKSTETFSKVIEFPASPQATENVHEVAVKYEWGEDSNWTTTLAPQRTEPVLEWPVVELTADSEIHPEGIINIAIRNEQGLTFSDFTATIQGEIIENKPLSEETKTTAEFTSGDEMMIVGYVDTKARQAQITVVLEGHVNGESVRQVFEFKGPVAQSAAEWTDNECYEQWERVETDSKPTVVHDRSHLTTPYLPKEGGNPQ